MSKSGPEMLTLGAGRLALQLCPEIGGSIAAFRWDHPGGGRLDLMRPLSDADLAAGNVLGMASFPLTPYSNRINEGRFTWRGQNIALPLNALPERHPQHGHGLGADAARGDPALGRALLDLPARLLASPAAAASGCV